MIRRTDLPKLPPRTSPAAPPARPSGPEAPIDQGAKPAEKLPGDETAPASGGRPAGGAPRAEDSLGRLRVEQVYAQRIEDKTIAQLEEAREKLDGLATRIYTGEASSAELREFTDHVGTILEGARPQSPPELKLLGAVVQSMDGPLQRLEQHPPHGGGFSSEDTQRISADAAAAREALGSHVRAMADRFRKGG